jgi:hypothetical protein
MGPFLQGHSAHSVSVGWKQVNEALQLRLQPEVDYRGLQESWVFGLPQAV